MKTKTALLNNIACMLSVVLLSGCAGYAYRSTPPTKAYKPEHEYALNGDVADLEKSREKDPALLNVPDADGNTPLILASSHGKIDAVKFLIRNGASLNATNHQQQTALILAAKAGQTDVVRALVQAGANYRLKDSRGWDGQTWAHRQSHEDTAREIRSFIDRPVPATR